MMRLLLMFGILACEEEDAKLDSNDGIIEQDVDGDGYSSAEDCDDSDALINPGVEEICDGLDNNCNDQVDEEVTSTFYADSDQDGFGNPNISTGACDIPDGFVNTGTDCDDTDATIYPSAEEVCDGLDNNCNDEVDEELFETYYLDNDGDGFGDINQPKESCELADGLSLLSDDCDDQDSNINPLVAEECDGLDNNCDGSIDEGVLVTYYLDNDEDGFGDDNNTETSCDIPEGYVFVGGDCDDINNFSNPQAVEYCDGSDNDCDGSVDEAGSVGSIVHYTDSDGDGFGEDSTEQESCTVPVGNVLQGGDCNDAEGTANPAMVELCDALDNDCDGSTDEADAIDQSTWYIDSDGDGEGDFAVTMNACDQPTGYVANELDCDDGLGTVNSSALEECDGIDNNCDGNTDEDSAVDAATYYSDSDGDGYGDAYDSVQACSAPIDFLSDSSDCDDNDDDINPDAVEECDGEDNNCDGSIDGTDAIDQSIWYVDSDGDGYGESSVTTLSCDQPINYTDNTDDCDDSDSTVYQYYGGASDVCAGIDCSDIVDLGFAQGDGTYWIDPDGNGAYQVYCDMTTDGGGWTLVAKIEDDSNSAWTYHEPKWVNAGEIFSETDFTLISGEAKYTSFDEVSFLEMRIQDPINGNDIILADAGSSVSQFLNQQNNEAATLSSMTITDSADIGYIGFTTQSSICESHVVSLLAQDQFFRYNSEGVYYANSGTATGNARIGLWGSGSNSHIWSWTSDCAMGLGLTTNGYQGSSATGSSFGRISLLWVR